MDRSEKRPQRTLLRPTSKASSFLNSYSRCRLATATCLHGKLSAWRRIGPETRNQLPCH
jgi:hypothetical protein